MSIEGGLSNERKFIGIVRTAHGHIFVPLGFAIWLLILGFDGLDIYKVEADGNLTYGRNFDKNVIFRGFMKPDRIYIVDVAIGGKNGEDLYLLDHMSGVIPMKLSIQNGLSY